MTDKRKATREKLLACARELFDELGFEKTNIIAVAQRAGVTKGAIYNNWNNKAELWAYVYGKPYVPPEERLISLKSDAIDAARLISMCLRYIGKGDKEASLYWAAMAKHIMEGIYNDK